jgi:hypothetical protein
MRPFLSACLAAAFALGTLAPAHARSAREEVSPAEEHEFPYDARIPACDSSGVLEEITSKFVEKETQYWNSSLRIVGYDHIERTAWRPYGLDYIPRRFCSAVATTSDGVRRRVDYSVRESLGYLSATWDVRFCVHGLDRNYANAPGCLEARP